MARVTSFAVLFLLSAAILAPQTAHAACGAEGKKPCPVWKGRASCDSGLVEDFSKNRCVRKSRPKPKPIIEPKKRPGDCGRINQRPCKVTEFIPSCAKGAVEDFSKNRCVDPTPKRPGSCGRLNQRPCTVVEFVPSCEKKLAENFAMGRCVAPGRPKTCGAKGQRPCKIVEAFPSCDSGLAEDFKRDRCVTPKPLKFPTCEKAVGFVKGQARLTVDDARADTDAFRAYLKKNPEAEVALEQAIARLKRKHAGDIKELSALAARLDQSKRSGLQKKLTEEQMICEGARDTLGELERLGKKVVGDKLSKGAITLSGAAEANAIVGVAGTAGLVFAYDADGQQRFGAQVSVQGQAVTDIDVAAGVQLGWWPGAKLTHSTADWTLDPAEVFGRPHDGLLSGPYVSVHAGAGPEALAEIEIAIDLVFEVPDLAQKVDVDWFIDHFAGITLTVTAGASLVPAQFSVGAAIGNTFTVALPPLK